MAKIKKILKGVYNCLKILFKYGPQSLIRKVENYKFHNQITKEEIDSTHIFSEELLNQQRDKIFEHKIKISILTPLYNTPEKFLKEMIDSVCNQTYSNWELCLADASDDKHSNVEKICKEYVDKDSRIIYKKLENNAGISGNTNECFNLASGDYIGLLDHDDLLHPSLFYEVVKRINETNADFLYTDEVKFENDIHNITDVKAFNFKPGFGEDDLRSHNFICHFTCYKKSLLDSEPALYRDEYNGSQDHDMVLRLTEKAKRIEHISKPLYYWRLHMNSVSMDLNSKPYVVDSAIRAVFSQLDRMNEKGTVQSSLPFQTIYKVEYPIENNSLISLLCLSNTEKSFLNFKDRILKNTQYKNLEFIKTDFSHYKDDISSAKGEYILLISESITPLNRTWIEELLMHAQRKDIFAASPKIYNKDYTIAFAGTLLDKDSNDYLYSLCTHDSKMDIGYEGMLCHVRNITAATRTCMLFKKNDWNRVKDKNIVKGYEEICWCINSSQQGLRNVFVPYAECMISKSQSIEKDARLFYKNYAYEIENDRFFNENWKKLNLA